MVRQRRALDYRLFVRRCVRCGYDGALLKSGHARRCARCGCDLNRRPARSYAEMEGLQTAQHRAQPFPSFPGGEERLIHRWLVFLFVGLIGVVIASHLMAAAFPV